MAEPFTGRAGDKIRARCDVVVVGAGAAGLKAATDLRAAGKSVVLVEARDRLGGRAFTRTDLCAPFDTGCHRLEDEAWWSEARRLRVQTTRQDQVAYARGEGRWSAAAYRPLERALGLLAAALAEPRDIAARKAFEEVRKEHLRDPDFLGRYELACSVLGPLEEGIEADRFSLADTGAPSGDGEPAPDGDYQPGRRYAAQGGFGALVQRYGTRLARDLAEHEGSQLLLGTAATNIKTKGPLIKVVARPHGGANHVIQCRAVIVTISTGVMNAGHLTFTPALAPDLVQAFASLPMGHAKRIALQIPRDVWADLDPAIDRRAGDAVDHVLYHDDPATRTAWKLLLRFPAEGAPDGTHLVVATVGGSTAEYLDRNEGRARDHALRILRDVTGDDQLRASAYAVSSWSTDPWSLGAFSYTAPGGDGARQRLAGAALEDRVFFAGEALSRHHYGTAHGAYRTGASAARRALEALGGA